VADFNGDGIDDVLSGHAPTGQNVLVRTLQTATLGTFGAQQQIAIGGTATQIGWIETGDLDGDGDIDALVTDTSTPPRFYVTLNDGHGNFTSLQQIATATAGGFSGDLQRPAIGDVNNDGYPDVVLPDSTNGVRILLGNGTGQTFTQVQVLTDRVGSVIQVVLGDFDGNGTLDIAATGNLTTIPVTVWLR